MAQQLQVYSITAPGFYGLNTQDSSLDLASGYALTANNCVIDKYGRIGARKGWEPQHESITELGSANIKTITELIDLDGTSYTLCAGNNKLFKLSGGVLSELTFNGTGTAPTITGDNWSTAFLAGDIYFFQRGHTPIGFSPNDSTTQYYRLDHETGYNGTVQEANIVLSAYGRLWTADTTTDKATVKWSDTLIPQKWNSGTAGSLDTTTVWPSGGDTIVALGAHNGFLFIFGYRNILIYQGAQSPGTMSLHDTIENIGCIARDSVVNTGSDIIFLSETGVRSIMRTIQEKSAPLRDLSKNVCTDLMNAVASENKENIKSVYNPIEGFYLLTLPTTKIVYCFDTKASLQDGSSRITIWDSIEPQCFCQRVDGSMLIGKAGYIGKYTNYQDNGSSYRFQYFTNHTDLGTPSIASILKRLSVVVIGGANQYVTTKWGYDFSNNYYSANSLIPEQGVFYYGIAEYNTSAEYSGGVSLQTLKVYPTGSGKVIQTGYESDINGTPLSIQKIEIQAKNGKLT